MRNHNSAALRLKILVIDGDEDYAPIIRHYLEDIPNFDCIVDWAQDFDAGRSRLAAEQFDLCFVDYRIGARTGTDFISAANRSGLNVPMILFTASSDPEIDIVASRTGAVDILSKDGLSPEILARSIRFAISNWEKTSELQKRQEQLEGACQELEQQKALLQLTMDHIRHGIALFDADNRLIACNHRYLDIYGFSPKIVRPGVHIDEIINYSISLGNYSEAEAERVLAERKVQITSPSPSTYHQNLADKRTISVDHVPIAGGRSVSTCQDITDVLVRERQSADLARSAALADAESVVKSKFLSNMSHELRTPLNAILGFSEVMLGEIHGPLGDNVYKEYAEYIYQGAHKLLSHVDRVLEMSFLLGEELDMEESAFQAQDIISTVVETYRESAEEKELVLRISNATSDIELWGDKQKVAQALENIVDNAVKFCLPGGIVVVSQKLTDPGDWVVSVSNTGAGISADDHANILSPFGQLEEGHVRCYHGAGLGLPIALGLIRLHGGDISIDGKENIGTTVSIKLPAHRVLSGTIDPSLSDSRPARRDGADSQKTSIRDDSASHSAPDDHLFYSDEIPLVLKR